MIDGKNNRKKWRPAELEDQTWFPASLRAYQMAFLSALDRITGLYLPVSQLLARLHPEKIVDLASGSGESVWRSSSNLRIAGAEVILTDKFPFAYAADRAYYHKESLDVLTSEFPKAELFTMFNAFHHFDPEERVLIAKKATKNGAALLIVEPLRPSVDVFLKVFLATLLGPFLLAPFMRPFSLKWLLLTYVLPLGVLATCWDGLASVIKSLSKNDWYELETDLSLEGKKVEHGLLPSRTTKLKYFLVK